MRLIALLGCLLAIVCATGAHATPMPDPPDPVTLATTGPDLLESPPPVAAGCPSLPVSSDPLAACPFNPATYYLWPGDDADAPLWTRCNYDSGDPANPCPAAHVGDDPWFFRCPDGSVWTATGPETDPAVIAATDMVCDGWESLSLP